MSDSDKIFGCVGIVAAFVVSLAVAAIMRGWALSVLWGWFFVSVFELPQLGIAEAIGVSLVISFLTANIKQEDADKGKDWSERLFVGLFIAIGYPLLSVVFGWIVLQFI